VEVVLDLLDLLLLALEERVLLLLLLVRLHHRRRVARHILQIHVHLLRQLQLPAIPYVVHIQPILHTVVYRSNDYNRENYQRVQETVFELSLCVVPGPQHTLIQLIKLFDGQGIKFVEYGFVQGIHLQRCELEIFVRKQPSLDNVLPLLVRGPHVDQVIL